MNGRSTGLLATLVMAAPCFAQGGFNYTDFSNTGTLNMLGSAAQAGTALRLTDLVSNQTGNAWHQTAQAMLAGFDTQFTFSILSGPTLAEGFAFVVHGAASGASTVGGAVWGLGYGTGANSRGIANSIAIEVDTYLDGFLGDTSDNEISVHTRGLSPNDDNETWSIGRVTPTTRLSNGVFHTMRILYVPGTLTIYVDNLTTPVLTVPYDFQTGGTRLSGPSVGGLNLPNGTGWVGFGATTGAGGLTERVLIHSWSFTPTPPLPPCFDGVVGVGTGGPVDVLTINGSNGGFFRTVEVASFDPFTIDVAAPPTNPSAPFVLFGTLGIATGSAALPVPPFGTFCFAPVVPIDLGPAPAPSSVQIPAGIPLLGALTLQGAILENAANPSSLAVTNAIGLEIVNAPAPTISGVDPLSTTAGATVTLNGAGFSSAAQVSVGGTPVTVSNATPTQVRFAFPAGVPCDSTVVLTNPDGQSDSAPINPTPSITRTVLDAGPAAGGSLFFMIGNGFSAGTTVTIGGAPATVVLATSTSLRISTPPGTPGPAAVVVTTPGGCTTTSNYTYF